MNLANQLTSLPNLLSSARLCLALPASYAIAHQLWLWASLCWVLAIASDLLDGWLARRLNCESTFGRLLDHGADAVFVTFCLLVLTHQERLAWPLTPLLVLAFGLYITEHIRKKAGSPTSLGKVNGVAYYILVGLPLLQMLFYWSWLGPITLALSWGLVVSTLLLVARHIQGMISVR